MMNKDVYNDDDLDNDGDNDDDNDDDADDEKMMIQNLYASVSPVSDEDVSSSVNSDTGGTIELPVAITVGTETEPQLSVVHSEHLQ